MDGIGMRSKLAYFCRSVPYTVLCRLLLFFYIIVPIVLKLFPTIFLDTVFSFKYKGPAVYTRLSNPDRDWNLRGATNHYLQSQSGNRIGLWHIPPQGKEIELLLEADKVIIYCHGKAGNRASGHRTAFYKALAEIGFHVITFDYSGFGDSAGIPDGEVVKLDTLSVYKWTVVQLQKYDATVVFWGHSLGSGVMTFALSQCSDYLGMKPPHGVILEAPFTNLYDASRSHPMFKVCNMIYPYLWRKLFKSSTKEHKMEFLTEKNLLKIKSNILMMHSEDDPKVNVKMSEILYGRLVSSQESLALSVHFYKFESSHGLGHNLIFSYSNLKEILSNFLDTLQGEVISEKLHFQKFTV